MEKPGSEVIKAWLTDRATDEQREEIYRDLRDRSGSVVYELFRSLSVKAHRVVSSSPNDPPSTVGESLAWLEKYQEEFVEVDDEDLVVVAVDGKDAVAKQIILAPAKTEETDESQPEFTLTGPTSDEGDLGIVTESKAFTLRDRPRRPRVPRMIAASLVGGLALFGAAFGYPPTRRMILSLIGAVPENVDSPLIPASSTAEANDYRQRIDLLRIDSGAFASGYRLQANDGRLIWYFDNLGLVPLCQTHPARVRQYLDCYFDHIDKGTFTIQDVTQIGDGTLQPSISDAPYAATMLSLAAAWREAGGGPWPPARLTLMKRIARETILGAQKPNGLVRNRVGLATDANCGLIDNCEVYRGLADFGAMMAKDGDADAEEFTEAARRVAAGIAGLYDDELRAFKAAEDNLDLNFNPHRVAQVFPEVYGVPLGNRARTAERYQAAWNFLDAAGEPWERGMVTDGSLKGYPWMVLGYAAAKHGRPDLARKQLDFFQRNLKDGSDPKFTAIHELGWAVRTIDLLEDNARQK